MIFSTTPQGNVDANNGPKRTANGDKARSMSKRLSDEIFEDKLNSLRRESVSLDEVRFARLQRHLSGFRFWDPGSAGVPRSLWDHQRRAISLGLAYLAANKDLPAEDGVTEAALIKMPTGTGKSGVIAVLARCLPDVKKVLVLTPRTALAEQLRRDVAYRFWGFLGFEIPEQPKKGPPKSFTANSATAGKSVETANVAEFLPKNWSDLLEAAKAGDRLVAIGTLQALDQIRRTAEDDDATDSKADAGEDDDAEPAGMGAISAEQARDVLGELSRFDLVIVDEGHYEPAASWSRSVRDLGLPTILLSATPYRNDYKAFRVRGNFVFNLPFGSAREKQIIRSVQFVSSAADVTSRRMRSKASDPGKRSEPYIKEFVALLRDVVPRIKHAAAAYSAKTQGGLKPKIIVRADDYEKLRVLQSEIEAAFGERPVLIHHRAQTSVADRTFSKVRDATSRFAEGDCLFWLHERKLLEGIDEASFVCVALYDKFSNARELVQQIGRVLRSTDDTRTAEQTAWVVGLPQLREEAEAQWQRYLGFEDYCARDPRNLVRNEAALPDSLLEMMPDYQYIDGDFRPKVGLGGPISSDQIRLPPSVSVFVAGKDFDFKRVEKEISEALIASDRFMSLRIADMPPESVGWTYYGWQRSPLLALPFFSIWTLGICVIMRHGPYVFVADTEGIVFSPDDIDVTRAGPEELVSVLPKGPSAKVRVSRLSLVSLDLSDQAIRSISSRARSFEETFGDLLDPIMVPTSASGFLEGRPRYVGLTRGRVSDPAPMNKSIAEFHQWTSALAQALAANAGANAVFDRYALLHGPLSEHDAAPRSILLDFDEDVIDYLAATELTRDGAWDLIDHSDLCADVGADGSFTVKVGDEVFECEVAYNATNGRYRISSDQLDKKFQFNSRRPGKAPPTICGLINKGQAFRLIVEKTGVIYARGRFYKPNLGYVINGQIPLLEHVHAVPILAETHSEKGEQFHGTPAKWRSESIFGCVHAICQAAEKGSVLQSDWGELGKRLAQFDLVVCDDDQDEKADFICLDLDRKTFVMVHAKAASLTKGSNVSVGAVQAVTRQASASLAFCSSVARTSPLKPRRWAGKLNANGKALPVKRVFLNRKGWSDAQMIKAVEEAIVDRSWKREIWMVLGRMMSRDEVKESIEKGTPDKFDGQTLQFLMHMDSLATTCARASATLRIFCHAGAVVNATKPPKATTSAAKAPHAKGGKKAPKAGRGASGKDPGTTPSPGT